MAEQTVTAAVWGKTGEELPVPMRGDGAVTVETVREAALQLMASWCPDGTLLPPRKRVVVLDPLGNPPRGTDLAQRYRTLFVFVLPGRDRPKEHPDVRVADVSEYTTAVPEPALDVQCTLLSTSSLPAGLQGSARRLGSVKRQLHHRAARCREFRKLAESRVDFCTQSLRSQQLQIRARDAVCAQLSKLAAGIGDELARLRGQVEAAGADFEQLLQTFDDDVARLRRTPVHPSLRAPGRETLVQLLAADPTQHRDRCRQRWRDLRRKLGDSGEQVEEVLRTVEQAGSEVPDFDFEAMDGARRRSADVVRELQWLEDTADKQLIDVADRLADLSRPAAAAPDPDSLLRTEEAVDAQSKREDRAVAAVRNLAEGCARCHQSRLQLQSYVSRHVEKAVSVTNAVIRMQRTIRAYAASFFGFEGVDGLLHYMKEFRILRYMPEAYKWGLVEAVRRREQAAVEAAWAAEWAERLEATRAEEARRRSEWQSRYGQLLPDGVLPGLRQPVDGTSDAPALELQPPYDTAASVAALYVAPDSIPPIEGLQALVRGTAPAPPMPAAARVEQLAAAHAAALRRISELEAANAALEQKLASQDAASATSTAATDSQSLSASQPPA